jgi:hypothetical protein
MTHYLISFDDGTMSIPDDELPAVAAAAHEVVWAAQRAGVWVFGGGVEQAPASVVGTDGNVRARPYPDTKAVVGGFVILDLLTHDAALEWAARIAVACRCEQEVRALMDDPLI